MKNKILIAGLLLFSVTVFAQIVDIPDPNFKIALLWHYPPIDTNGDNEIQVSEAEVYTGEIDVNGQFLVDHGLQRITDLTGIEAFSNLSILYCDDNLLTILDVSQNTGLTNINCSKNLLTTLDLSNNTALITLDCRENQLVNLNVSANSELVTLRCRVNQLSSLDVSNNINLEYLYCSGNDLASIDISQNTQLKHLLCIDNQLSVLDISHNINLRFLYCYINQLASLDISQNTLLGNFQCQNNQLTYLDVRNRHYNIFAVFNATDNPDLTCVLVDDIVYMEENWGDYIDSNSTFVETQEECDSLDIKDESILENINIYPNPTTGLINLLFSYESSWNNNLHLRITDILGKEVLTPFDKTDENQFLIDFSKQSAGLYLLNIRTKNKITIQKIIKL